jgi:mitochondrial fission protein ELM1
VAHQIEKHIEEGGPRIWLVLGEKPGDNAQIINLAKAVGWPCEEKKIFVQPQWVIGKPRVRPTLDHIDLARSDSLEGPWPDLVITAGRRLSCVGFWIKRASGGKTRLVMIGRPRRLHDSVDLIVVATHYVMRSAPNVVYHDLPLMHVDPHDLDAASAAWRSRLEALPRPLTALMVGGPTGGLRFDLEMARELFEKTLASVNASRGSLYITTSRRTPPDVAAMLRRECPDTARLYAFDAEAPASENPYHALLALADRFVVTTDSASMMVEVARLGRPLSIFPLESEIGSFEALLMSLGIVRPLSPRTDAIPAGGLRARTMYRLGIPTHARDLSAIPRLLVDKGMANWLGDDWVSPAEFVDNELHQIADRIRQLL